MAKKTHGNRALTSNERGALHRGFRALLIRFAKQFEVSENTIRRELLRKHTKMAASVAADGQKSHAEPESH